MREFNTPQQETPRATAAIANGNRKTKVPQTKKPQKIKTKRFSEESSSVEDNYSCKESTDFSAISEVVDSHHEADISKIFLPEIEHTGSAISDAYSQSNLTFSPTNTGDNFEKPVADRSLKQIVSLEPEPLGDLLTTAQSQILKSLDLNYESNKLANAINNIGMDQIMSDIHEFKCHLKVLSLESHIIFLCLSIWIVVKLLDFWFSSGFVGPLPT